MDGTELALRLSYDLDGVTDREVFLDAVTASLEAMFPSESLGWVGLNPVSRDLEIRGTGEAGNPEVLAAVNRNMYRHPQVLSYTSTSTMDPRRMSDIIGDRDWLNHPVFAETFAKWNLSTQLTIIVTPMTPNSWNGWAFNRYRRDYTDSEVEAAAAIQPVLVAFNRLTGLATPHPAIVERNPLTRRETEVLQLVGEGFTATAIGYILRISTSTVRKHVESAYMKLGQHDRVTAVTTAARLGIIRLPG
ncbi:LuxR C-terminal-related transcriptional regulator [Leifsonia sp. fls2-241-R2A-40a]|uniref:response regulator transcription factor n=1 Tax=Leifsonia sp. fls2-241-R2A-40a TaxID=3040290 RepID=UPI00254FC53C|nr:LuxR C-terminal-related transcriptional regulator [Leifsonia sp. fls2-241-R2A-40a]